MAHEISEFGLADRQLLMAVKRPSSSRWTDIGKARVVGAMSGKARIRVSCERDQVRRLWLLAGLAASVMIAVAWQVIIMLGGSEAARNLPAPLSESIHVSAPTFQPAPEVPSSRDKRRMNTPDDIGIAGMMENLPPKPAIVVKPVAAASGKPSAAGSAGTPPSVPAQTAAANRVTTAKPVARSPIPQLSPPLHQETQAAAAKPADTPHVVNRNVTVAPQQSPPAISDEAARPAAGPAGIAPATSVPVAAQQ